jgi:ABC-type nickel/cobalt efflux system permease component RcnA
VFEPIQYLLTTAAVTGLMHTLIPDHWLPFVLIGRARSWSVGTTASVSGFSALVHVTLSALLGLIVLGLGLTAGEAVGESLERASNALLVIFGVGYALWAWRKGGHFHPGGARLHSELEEAGCAGGEGDQNPDHLHYHADDRLIVGDRRPNYWLALIIGANPCVLLLPLLLSAAERGSAALAMVTLAYAVPTVALMVGLSSLGVARGRRVRLPGVARHMEMASGLLIAALGIVLLLIEH